MSEVALSASAPSGDIPIIRTLNTLPHSQPDWRYRLLSWFAQPWVVKAMLRVFGARMTADARNRWRKAGVLESDLNAVLPTIHSLEAWWAQWRARAEQREREAHRALDAGLHDEATTKFTQAAALYYLSATASFLNVAHHSHVSRKLAETYAYAAPYLNPPAQRVLIPFEGIELAAYLRMPVGQISPSRPDERDANLSHPIVILIHGTGAVKEDLRDLEEKLLARGVATLSVDGPGVGETWEKIGWLIEQERVAAAELKFLEGFPQLDVHRVALMGISLGGMTALRMASHAPSTQRFKAVAAICPPYDGAAYFHVVPFFVREMIRFMAKSTAAELRDMLPRSSLRGHIQKIRCPLLVVGAGRDSIVPANDARLIIGGATCEKELIWYPRDEHVAREHLDEWPIRVAEWLCAKMNSEQ